MSRAEGPAFGARLRAKVAEVGSPLCLGIDPRASHLPPALLDDGVSHAVYFRFISALLDIAEEEGLPAVKIQIAFFEAMGTSGFELFAHTLRRASARGLLTIADAKRGDIGSTAEAYAEAYLGEDAPFPADSMTVNPYLGGDALEPFARTAERRGKGLFCLVRTSNPGGVAWQDAPDDAFPVCERVASWIRERNAEAPGTDYGPIGAVVGATAPEAAARLRKLMPRAIILAPGVGAQGGDPAHLAAFADANGEGVLVPVSRAISGAWQSAPDKDWKDAIRDKVRELRASIDAALPRATSA